MGQKANPIGLRLGIVREHESNWFDIANYPSNIVEDVKVRKLIQSSFSKAGVIKTEINRKADQFIVTVTVARPGILFGKNVAVVDDVKLALTKVIGKKVELHVVEEKSPDLSSQLIGEWIVGQLEKRMPFRRIMKQSVQRTMKSGAYGVKVSCSGRLGGAEIARTEWYREGRVPLHTFRADIDYSLCEAQTTYGKIGVKVWVYKGDVIRKKNQSEEE